MRQSHANYSKLIAALIGIFHRIGSREVRAVTRMQKLVLFFHCIIILACTSRYCSALVT